MSDLELNVDRPILSEGADYKLVPLDEDVWGCYVNKYDTTVVFGKIGFDEDGMIIEFDGINLKEEKEREKERID